MTTSLKVAVIGAGVGGLITARELKRESHQVVVFEKSHRLGGTWAYDPRVEDDLLGLDPDREIVHGSLYKSMRTNLPRQLMSFTDFKFGEKEYGDPRLFPGHNEVLMFLEDFASNFQITELIRFKTVVTRVEAIDSGITEFVVESMTNQVSSVEVFDAVVICSGNNTQPRLATYIPGIETWSKKQMHSHNYRVPEPFRNQIVVVIGSGPSGVDLSREISTVAKEVHMSSRSPNVKVSKLEKFNNLWQHSKIECINKNGTITFQDGPSVEADIIFHCTGYKFHVPFLKTNGIISVEDEGIGPLYKHIFPPQLAPRLSFVGLPKKGLTFPIIECQSRWIAQALSRKVSLPSKDEMLCDVKEYYRIIKGNVLLEHDIHSVEFKGDYMDWISAQTGMVVEKRLQEKFTYLIQCFISYSDEYKDLYSLKYGK
ncbi:flavin-containing monooxygenase FMO GS-OX5-like [Cynara cardunculus var. scolymus]|uniref:flavin-containing monooxygenase FMO GS-OX5-like n=1 Tax=Cynara cardunculus var. scolymus TaxID=59895 RepID=UPI000D6263F4|nr:flavin-containing monooxygenase FMO GS-OX5-like [Cynara cardunculus var. scolymus]